MKTPKEMNELELYFVIDYYGGFIWRMNHDMCDGRIPEKDWTDIDKDIEEMKKLQKEAVAELPRIGVNNPLNADGKPTDTYWTWYRTWDQWKKDLSDEKWRKVNHDSTNGLTDEDVARYKSEAFNPNPPLVGLSF